MMNILYLLPKNLLSRCVGSIVHWTLPEWLRLWSIQAFGNFYKIRFDEAEKSIENYASIGDFFIRKLKSGVRPIDTATAVHPADACISQLGRIEAGKLIQAKGKYFGADQILKDPEALTVYSGGLFATYYLCPTDYHRVHAPVDGVIESVTHIPGALWPVNNWSVERIEDLFCVNERVVIQIKTNLGPVALVLVGATNVGKISLSFEPALVSNQCGSSGSGAQPRKISYQDNPKPIKRGDELGIFHMGSTVVMLYSRAFMTGVKEIDLAQFLGHGVKLGRSFLE